MAEAKLYGTVVVRAKEILDFIAQCRTAPTLKDISDGIEMTKPTVLKILTTLDVLGLVHRSDDGKTYQLGMELFRYGQKVAAEFDIRQLAQGPLSELRDQTEETINLGVIAHHQVTLLKKFESPQSVNLKSQIGGSMTLYSSSMGKAMLSTFTDEQLDKYFTEVGDLQQIGPNTITSPDKLREDLIQVKNRGYSIDNEENEPDVYCLGFSLVKDNELYGAFSITTPKYRMSIDRQEDFIKWAKTAQTKIIATL